jgi:hypothetical protein
MSLRIGSAGPEKNTKDVNRPLLMVAEKEEPVVADAPPENTFPLLALQGFYVALEWVAFHLSEQRATRF